MMVHTMLYYHGNLLNRVFVPEFAEFTSAQERIALGKKSRKVEASKRRDAMKEMIADAYVLSALLESLLKFVVQRRRGRRDNGMGARTTSPRWTSNAGSFIPFICGKSQTGLQTRIQLVIL